MKKLLKKQKAEEAPPFEIAESLCRIGFFYAELGKYSIANKYILKSKNIMTKE